MIAVTQTFLPPMGNYQQILQRAWDSRWITNRGALVLELEETLKTFLSLPHLTLTTNGTLPLQIAIKAMGLSGEIITTPFSYVATTSSIVWENCTPVFVDIHPEYFTIDETRIEAAITAKTEAILATHVFGNPCDVKAIEAIAQKHGLKVIYDAAHAFGVTYLGQSLFAYGDVSTCSFHATKIFHTGEGGCMITSDAALHEKLYYHHNFGHNGPLAFHGVGINAKMSELQAAMGLAVFPYLDEIKNSRQKIVETYNALLKNAPVQRISLREGTEWNYSYYPIVFRDEADLLRVQAALNRQEIFPRRYFYPSINTIPYAGGASMPVSESVASRVLCLPLYVGLGEKEIFRICKIIEQEVVIC